MEITHDVDALRQYMQKAVYVSPGNPILIDNYLQDAIEVDVDVVADPDRMSSLRASWSISRRRASIRATARARCRRIRCRPQS
jgi:hypothetical protein